MQRNNILFLCSLLIGSSHAWSSGPMIGSSVSGFGGRILMTSPAPAPACPVSGSTLEMKKGNKMPQQMRGQYEKSKKMNEMRQAMEMNSKQGADGLPVFNLFVRTKIAKMWYPCGSFKGDERSMSLAKSYADDGILSGIAKKQLDGGIAGSLYSDLEKLKDTVTRAYPQLKNSRNELEYGYKLAFDGLTTEQANSVNLVEPKEMKGPLDNVKNLFS